MKWYLMAWKNYFKFSGRSRRKEFWYFILFNFIASFVLGRLDMLLGTYSIVPIDSFGGGSWVTTYYSYYTIGTLGTIYSFLAIIPLLALYSRRLHDVNRTALWILAPIIYILLAFALVFLAFIAPSISGILMIILSLAILAFAIIFLVWMCTEGTSGSNQYGADPKGGSDMSEYGGIFEETEN